MRAEAIGESYVWNIAMSRSLCEMVRRMPTSIEELRLCWGFGGKGLRAQRHGDFLIAALEPHLPQLRAALEGPTASEHSHLLAENGD